MNETMASERLLARLRGRHSRRGSIAHRWQVVFGGPERTALLDPGQLARIHFQPDVLLDLEHFVRAGRDTKAEVAARRPHRVVPVLAEVRSLHDLSRDQTHALA